MASKIAISNVFFFINFYNDLKLYVQALIDPLSRPCTFQLDQTSSFQAADI